MAQEGNAARGVSQWPLRGHAGMRRVFPDVHAPNSEVEPLAESDILGRTGQSLIDFQAGPLMDYMPYTPNTRRLLEGLAALEPRTLATMHGSSFAGDGTKALIELESVMKEMLGGPRPRPTPRLGG